MSSSANVTRRWGTAVMLGLGAMALNQIPVPFLSSETPAFLFLVGGALVFIAFVCYGEGPGLLAAGLAISPLYVTQSPFAVMTSVYLAEGWVAYRVYRRTSSLVVGVAVFWFGIGWLFDLAVAHFWVGLTIEYVALLLVKQLFNGLMSATAAEMVLQVGPIRRLLTGSRGGPPTNLRQYSFSRVVLVVLVPSLVLGLTQTRAAFNSEIARVRSESSVAARAVGEVVGQYIDGLATTVERTARRMEAANAVERPEAARRLLALVPGVHPELAKSAVFDANGVVVASWPRTELDGTPIEGIDISRQQYYQELLRRQQTVVPPLLEPTIKVDERGPVHVMLLAEPIFDELGDVNGGLVVALDPAASLPSIRESLGDPAEYATIFDQAGQVVISTDPSRLPGTDLFAQMHQLSGEPVESGRQLVAGTERVFSYYPPPDTSLYSRLRLNPNYASYQPIAAVDWGVLIDLPAPKLFSLIVPAAYSALAIVFLAILVVYVLVAVLSRQFSGPIVTVKNTVADVAAGRLAPTPGLPELLESPVTEVRTLVKHLMTMQETLEVNQEESLVREGETLERFRATFDQAAVGIAHTSPGGAILRINQKFCEMLGGDVSQLLGKTFAELSHENDRHVETTHVGRLLSGMSDMYSMEKRLIGLEGGAIWVQVTVSLTRTAGGAPKYFMTVAQDINERKALEEQFRQSQKMESIGLLAGGMAHDFNNLLTPILGYAELGVDESDGHPVLKESFEKIHSAANRAKELTWQLLAFSRKQVLEFKTLDPAGILHSFAGIIGRVTRENIVIDLRVDSDLGAIRADSSQIQQILMNLAINAQDAMPDGGRLTISAKNVEITEAVADRHADLDAGPAIVIAVSDTGVGIPSENLEKVFEPFFTTKEIGKGTGLGMATVYGIVRQHLGAVAIESEVGLGTTVEILLPRVEGAPDLGGVVEQPDEAFAAGGSETVLVVEDEPAVRNLVGHALRNQGYQVIEAANAELAVDAAKNGSNDIDLLLTDVILPNMNGRQLRDTLVDGRPDLRVLYMSGYSRQVLSADGTLDSGTHLLKKPFSVQHLTQKVREVLDG